MYGEVGLRLREIAQVSFSVAVAILFKHGVTNHRDATLGLDMGVILIVCDEADTRVVPDVFGVFGQGADEDKQATIVIDQIRRDGAEGVTIEFLR